MLPTPLEIKYEYLSREFRKLEKELGSLYQLLKVFHTNDSFRRYCIYRNNESVVYIHNPMITYSLIKRGQLRTTLNMINRYNYYNNKRIDISNKRNELVLILKNIRHKLFYMSMYSEDKVGELSLKHYGIHIKNNDNQKGMIDFHKNLNKKDITDAALLDLINKEKQLNLQNSFYMKKRTEIIEKLMDKYHE